MAVNQRACECARVPLSALSLAELSSVTSCIFRPSISASLEAKICCSSEIWVCGAETEPESVSQRTRSYRVWTPVLAPPPPPGCFWTLSHLSCSQLLLKLTPLSFQLLHSALQLLHLCSQTLSHIRTQTETWSNIRVMGNNGPSGLRDRTNRTPDPAQHRQPQSRGSLG